MTLGDRVAVLQATASCSRWTRPQHLYRHPANLFVAAFIGSPPMNLVEATVDGDQRDVRRADSRSPSDAGRSPPSKAAR